MESLAPRLLWKRAMRSSEEEMILFIREMNMVGSEEGYTELAYGPDNILTWTESRGLDLFGVPPTSTLCFSYITNDFFIQHS